MYRKLCFLIFYIIYSVNGFNNCAQTYFCEKLRRFEINEQQQYNVLQDKFKIDDNGEAVFTLMNGDGQIIYTRVTPYVNGGFRITVDQDGIERYKLTDVLLEEPEKTSFILNEISDYKISLRSTNDNQQVDLVTEDASLNFYGNEIQGGVFIDLSSIFFDQESSAFRFKFVFPTAIRLYGFPHHAHHLTIPNTQEEYLNVDPFRLYNVDNPGYNIWSTEALYGSSPVAFGIDETKTSGIFFHNAAQQWIDTNTDEWSSRCTMIVEGGSLDLFILGGATPKNLLRSLTELTGKAHLPQFWALGYHQSRYSYESQEDVKNVIAQMDQNDFPMDAIWLDIDYTDEKKYFTWDPKLFSDPLEMQLNISSTNRKLITIIDPHIKVDSDYSVYTEAVENQLFVKNEDGTNFEGTCWPGESSYLDFLNPSARDFYADQFLYENFPNTTETLAGIWNDMNEPSVFDTYDFENTLPTTSEHIGGVKHRDIHNIYGFLQTKATHQGLMQRDNGTKRPFILTRSSFTGSQRYAAFWTGDNDCTWEYLTVSIPMCLTANMFGYVFCGADVGGFISNPSEELFQRWFQVGIWLPFFRSHSNKGTERREPYLFSEDVQKVLRDAIKLRYKHLPVWYTLFYEHTVNGDPIIRPLVYEYPTDQNAWDIDNHILLGSDILIRPVLEPGVDSIDVYFPEQNSYWFQLNNNLSYSGDTQINIHVDITFIPVFYKAGSIVARKDTERTSTSEMLNDPFTLYVNLNQRFEADGTLYLDDFESFEYTNNKYSYVSLSWKNNNVVIEPISGSMEFQINIDKVIVNRLPDLTGESGVYVSEEFSTTRDGKFLSELQIDARNTYTLEL